MSAFNFNDNMRAQVAQYLDDTGAGTEVEDTGIDMYGCEEGVVLIEMGYIAGGSLVIKAESDEILAGTYGTTSDGDGEQTITTAVLTTMEVKNMKRYWRIVYTDSAHAKIWACIYVGWAARSVPIA